MGKRSRSTSFTPPAEAQSPSSLIAISSTSPSTTGAPSDEPASKVAIHPTPRSPPPIMHCSLPPHHHHPLPFSSQTAFTAHYLQSHTNRCTSCSANLPSPHLLALHIDETHNPLRQVREERGEKTYACFLEDCGKVCADARKRRLHLIDKHGFPKEYDFSVVRRGVDGLGGSLLKGEGRRRRISTGTETELSAGRRRRAESSLQSQDGKGGLEEGKTTMKAESDAQVNADAEMDDLDRAMSALRFVPPSVTRRQKERRDGMAIETK